MVASTPNNTVEDFRSCSILSRAVPYFDMTSCSLSKNVDTILLCPDFSNYEIHPKSQHNFNAQLFPGYVHKSTLGHLSKVNNGNARTYVFSKKIKEVGGDNFCPSTPFTMSIQLCAVNDEDIREMVMEILKSLQDSASNVLDIRRQFPEALRSDTRQLNRVLYEMEASNKVMRVPPKKCNQKPTWSLSTM